LERVERENFRRMCREELPEGFVIHQGEPWGYRNRARVVYLGVRDGRCRFGFRKQESNGVVAVDNCPVLTPALNDFLKNTTAGELFGAGAFKGAAAGSKRVPRDLEISLFDNGVGKVSFYYKGMPPKLREARCPAQVEILGRHIQSDASVFFQSNLSLLPRLVQSVQQAVDEGIASGAATDEWLIDLFSGVGFFACILRDRFKRITTVERDPLCLEYAKVNLSGTGGAVENVAAPAEEWLAKNVVDVPATLIVDPPRTGLPPEALRAIVQSSVQRLIYVSCDPVTLFRDFTKFREAGFELKKAEGFAFYPQTPHLEMMFVLSR
jgi:23S rRNA (uracil1939-C5)-methyltransferase